MYFSEAAIAQVNLTYEHIMREYIDYANGGYIVVNFQNVKIARTGQKRRARFSETVPVSVPSQLELAKI